MSGHGGTRMTRETGWSRPVLRDPVRQLVHDFRNDLGELVFAVERQDSEMVQGMSRVLQDEFETALHVGAHGGKTLAAGLRSQRAGSGTGKLGEDFVPLFEI